MTLRRLRVLHVVPGASRRGAEIFTEDLVRAFAAQGVEQHVAFLHASLPPEMEMDAPVSFLDRRGMSGGCVKSLQQGRALSRLVKTWRPDIVQAHGGTALEVSVGAWLDVPVVYRRIGSAPSQLRHGWRRLLYGRLMSGCEHVVAVAEVVKNETMRLFGLPADRITVIPNAIDPTRLVRRSSRYAIRAQLGIDTDTRVVLSMGALSWEKDPLSHVRIAAAAAERVPDVFHLIVGDGSMRNHVERAIRTRARYTRARVIGAQKDVADYLAAADVLLFASRPDGMEGMPAVVIESGFMGVPVAAYDVAGVPEVVTNGATGFIVEWGNETALVEAVVRLITDSSLRKTFGAAARNYCRTHFDIAAVSADYLSLYRRLVPAVP